MRSEKRRTPAVAGHKCAGASLGVRVSCECGWSSSTWYGQGARRSAYNQWRTHAAEHRAPAKVAT